MQKQVTLIGLGYVGLPLAALLADRGFQVTGVDIDPAVVSRVNCGETRSAEPGLDQRLRQAVASGTLRASLSMVAGEVYVIAVPTPLDGQRQPDLRHVHRATSSLAPLLKAGDLVLLESTSPVGTTAQLSAWLAEARADLRFPHEHGALADVRIAYCPERVLPGNALVELAQNDRVIGGLSASCAVAAASFYQRFVSGECLLTDSRSAELCKLAENSFRDLNIAFANELSMISERLGVDAQTVIQLANRHPRVAILQPGPGVGGHCVAVDPWFLVQAAPDLAQLTRTAREVNDRKPAWVLERVEQAVAELVQQGNPAPSIACLGLSFKADSDDLRESPALAITQALAQRFAGRVCAVEPNLAVLPREIAGAFALLELQEACRCDVLVLLVNHRAFREQPLPVNAQQRLVAVVGQEGMR